MKRILAIRGENGRGSEVITLLKNLSGSDILSTIGYNGLNEDTYYFVDSPTQMSAFTLKSKFYMEHSGILVLYTLDEFKKKYPYILGDRVKTSVDREGFISRIKWCVNDIVYWVTSLNDYAWTETLSVDVLDKYNEKKDNKEKEIKKFNKSIIWHLRNSINNGKQSKSAGELETYFREITGYVDDIQEDKMISLNKAREWVSKNANNFIRYDVDSHRHVLDEDFYEAFAYAMKEQN